MASKDARATRILPKLPTSDVTESAELNSRSKADRVRKKASRKPRQRDRTPSKERVVQESPNTSPSIGLTNPNLNNSNSVAKNVSKLPIGRNASDREGESQPKSSTDVKRPKKRPRKKKVNASEADAQAMDWIDGLGVDIAQLHDDIVEGEDDAERPKAVPKGTMKSQPVNKMYMEQSGGFRAAEKHHVEQQLYTADRPSDTVAHEVEPDPFLLNKEQTLAFALISHKVLRTLSFFIMGLLAGISLWQTFLIYELTQSGDSQTFLDFYKTVSVPINCAFYIMLVVSAVAVFDRYDVAKMSRGSLGKACTLQSGAVATLLYLTALCVNVSLAPIDDRFGLHTNVTFNETIFYPSKEARVTDVNTWKILTLVRTVLILIAWFTISLRPETDRLTKNLSLTEATWSENVTQGVKMTSSRTDTARAKHAV